ncbi:MAG TPA: phosphatase PAP2 family protein [Methylomirabilota bacterium]|jgi:undecaprenyl-diphosphatase|nr:phosphatase PAP2 family protein [Methylomirabilota bacterium]
MKNAAAHWRIVCLITLAAFLGLSVVTFATGLLPGDDVVRRQLLEDRTSFPYRIARVVDLGGSWPVLLPATILLFVFSATARRHWWLWTAILLGSSVIEHAFKFLVGRPRPSGLALGFPSGHATAAATFAVVLIYVVNREHLAPTPRWLIQALAIVLMVLVGWARVVLRAHWPTDVLGGFLLGAGCAAAGAWWESVRHDAVASGAQRRA